MLIHVLGGTPIPTQGQAWGESEGILYLLLGLGMLLTLIVFGFFLFILTRKEK